MAKIDYDFNLTPHNRKRQNDQWSRRMRLTMLFCAVALVTAAVVYALVPKKSPVPVKPPVSEKTAQAAQTEQIAHPEQPQEIPEKSEPAPETTQTETTQVSDSESAPASLPEDTSSNEKNSITVPEKGKITADDPAPEADIPQQSGERNIAGENKLTALLTGGDIDGFFTEADSLIRETAVNSAARTGFGKILTDARKQLWQNGNWKKSAYTHKVVSGDNLSLLARRYHTTVNMLKKGNSLKDSRIMIGQKLKIMRGPWKLQINKSARTMTLLRKTDGKEVVFALFPIGIGRKNSTPAGNFVICHSRFHPVYRDPQGRVFKYGDKNNPLGAVFLALALPEAPAKPYRGYGIHGTADDSSVGRSLSNGCIRMHNDDVTMLYYLLPAGTAVEITE